MSSGVQFDEDKFNYSSKPQPNVSKMNNGQSSSGGSGLSGWLIRKGFAKSENSAQVILISVLIINVIVTFLLIYFYL